MFWLPLLLSCSFETVIEPWPKETNSLINHCQEEPIAELQTICWIQAAAQSIQTQKKQQAIRICQKIQQQTWQRECYFRIGEELSMLGQWQAGLHWCSQSGPFAQSCITHSFWRAPMRTIPPIDTDASTLRKTLQKIQNDTESALKSSPDHLIRQSVDNIRAQFVHSFLVGSGQTRVDLAHEAGEFGAWFRTVYAIEAARILAEKQNYHPQTIVDSWRQKKDFYGSPDLKGSFKGRYRHTRIPKHEKTANRVLSFAGSSRIHVEDPALDIQIAALEGFFWVEQTPLNIFKAYQNHSIEEIRWTANRLLSSAPR